MTAEQAARRWRERRTAQARRDVELETFPTTAGSKSKNAHPMFGGQGRSPHVPVAGGSGDLCLVVASFFASDSSKERADYVCPTWFGNDAVIQGAIDRLTNNGNIAFDTDQPGRIMLTEGSFYLDQTVTVKGCEIEGVSGYDAGTVIYSNEEITGPLFLVDTDRGGRFANLYIEGGFAENIRVQGDAIENAKGVWIQDCVISAAIDAAVVLDKAYDVWVKDCHIKFSSGGIDIRDSENIRVDGCTFPDGHPGVKVDGDCLRIWITDNQFSGAATPREDQLVVESGATEVFVTGNVTNQDAAITASLSVVSGNVFDDATLSLTTSIDGPNIINGVVVP